MGNLDEKSNDFYLSAPLAALIGFIGGASHFIWDSILKRFRSSSSRL
jgi:hypothetical protein